jgi:hypothetical protein
VINALPGSRGKGGKAPLYCYSIVLYPIRSMTDFKNRQEGFLQFRKKRAIEFHKKEISDVGSVNKRGKISSQEATALCDVTFSNFCVGWTGLSKHDIFL